jgi:class 3 adenylate cyclase/Tfp pilus assembly protein PilF
MECGSALEGDSRPAAASLEPAAPARPREGAPADLPEERRQVTVLFADLSGYTAVAERLDPEFVKALVDRSLRRLAEEVERYGGSVDKFIGDNVMAVFGAPVAHEDDAERAVRTALAMQDAMEEINRDLDDRHGVSFALRVGVNTGEVLAGAVGDGYTVTGDTVNVAARLQSAGEPGTVTVGERTVRATRDAVAYGELDPLELKGKAEPVPAWAAIGLITERPTRRALPPSEGPLVGRGDELGVLESLYERVARECRPHLVTLMAPAGTGKSRLLRELERRLSDRETPPSFREGRCLPYGAGVVYWALAEVIRAECEIVDTDSSESAWQKLEQGMERLLGDQGAELEDPPARRAALIGRLLGFEITPEIEGFELEDPQRMRESYFSAVRSCIDAMASQRPLVLGFEDIHWADEGMLDLIEYLAQWVRGPVLILCLARDELLERRPGWGGGRRNASSIGLEPLTVGETSELVRALLPEDGHGAGAVTLVAERAGGNPLFAEEMARRLTEEEGGVAAELPDTVQAVLAARIDSLEPFERQLVQQAAVVGRTFWVGSLATLAMTERRDLEQALMALQEKDIIVPGSGSQLAGERELAFRHVLIRDVAYAMLPKAVRCRKHWEVARFIEERVGDRGDEFVSLLAEHYSRAADLGIESGLESSELEPIRAKALEFLEAAGDASAAVYSNPEALERYETARAACGAEEPAAFARLGNKLGDVAMRLGRADAAIAVWQEGLEHHVGEGDQRAVGELHRKIGAALWQKGETKPAIEQFQRGINLLKDADASLELVRLYEEAASLYMHTGDNMLAIYAAEKALRLSERLEEVRAAGRAHGIFGRVFGRIGDTAKARENLERSVELARQSGSSETIAAVLALGYHLETTEADYEEAERAYTDAFELAQEVGDLPAQVELRSALALLAAYRADWEAVREHTEASAGLAEREGLVGKLSYPYGLRALLLWKDGDIDAAVEGYHRAHALAEQVGWSEVAFHSLFGLALALRDRGEPEEAAAVLERALEVCERAGLVAQSIQALSLRAVLLALAGSAEEAGASAAEAVRLAEGLPYPVGKAAALEARGATESDPAAAAGHLREARERWHALGQPLYAARSDLMLGRALAATDPDSARQALEAAAEEFEALGVGHMAERARELAATGTAAG